MRASLDCGGRRAFYAVCSLLFVPVPRETVKELPPSQHRLTGRLGGSAARRAGRISSYSTDLASVLKYQLWSE